MADPYALDLQLPKSVSQNEKQFLKSHKIRRLEQKIVAQVQIFFSVKTQESRQECMNLLRELNDQLCDLEILND